MYRLSQCLRLPWLSLATAGNCHCQDIRNGPMFRRIIYLFSRNEPVESIALSLKPVPKQRWRNKAERPRPNPNFGVRVYDPLCTWVIDSKTQFEKTFCKNEYLTIGKCQDVLEEEQWRYLRVIFLWCQRLFTNFSQEFLKKSVWSLTTTRC